MFRAFIWQFCVSVQIDVFAVKTGAPALSKLTARPPPLIVIADPPNVCVLVAPPVFREANVPHAHVCPFVLSVPAFSVTAPDTADPAECVSVKSDLFTVIDAAAPPVANVTVAAVPEFASNVTVSTEVGLPDRPPVPPEVVAQCRESVVPSHVPVPTPAIGTQKNVVTPPVRNGTTNIAGNATTSTAKPSRTFTGQSFPTTRDTRGRGARESSLRHHDSGALPKLSRDPSGIHTTPSKRESSTRAGQPRRSATPRPETTAVTPACGGGYPGRPPGSEAQLPASVQRLERPSPTQ